MARELGACPPVGPGKGRPAGPGPGPDHPRVVQPGSKLSTLTWWADVTLGADLGIAGALHR